MEGRATQLLLVVMGAVLGAVLAGSGPSPALAQQAGGQHMFAVTAPGQGQGANVLFVIDPQTQRILVYEHRVGGKLELTAVRSMEFEVQFQQWPAPAKGVQGGSEPPVKELKELIDKQTNRGG